MIEKAQQTVASAEEKMEETILYLDESLKNHTVVYPAAGNDHSGVQLSIAELEACSGYKEWINVSRDLEEEI